MTTKAAIIATAAILIGVIVLGLGAVFLFIDRRALNANERAAMLGQGMAMLCMIPLFIVWVMWAARFRQERDQKSGGGPRRRNPSR